MITQSNFIWLLVGLSSTAIILNISTGLRGLWIQPPEYYLEPYYESQVDDEPPEAVVPFERYIHEAPECSPLIPDDVSFTLVTQFSMHRLWQMRYHCLRWGNSTPISVAILTNVTQTTLTEKLVTLGCNRDMITVQTLPLTKGRLEDYPTNVLRRIALSAVRTSHVMYVDIDFWLSSNLNHVLHQRSVREAMASDSKRALVVPTFKLEQHCTLWDAQECRPLHIPMMPATQQEILNVLDRAGAFPYESSRGIRGGHSSTEYNKWRTAQKSGDLHEIPCFKNGWYEPFVAFRYCRDLPPPQSMFTGYGQNKIQWIMHMRREGYLFTQLGGAFVIHFPHPISKAKQIWKIIPNAMKPTLLANGKIRETKPRQVKDKVDWTNYKRRQVDTLMYEFNDWLNSEVEDRSRVPMCKGSIDIDVVLWRDRAGGHGATED